MSEGVLPQAAELPRAGWQVRRAVMATLFERSAALDYTVEPVLLAVAESEDKSYKWIIEEVRRRLMDMSESLSDSSENSTAAVQLRHVLESHPRLGEKKERLEPWSAAEQANLQAQASFADEQELSRLNAEYEQQFHGLRYLVFVNGRGRPEIFEDMHRRMDRNDQQEEYREAINALCDIAWDRVKKAGPAR